jgi:RimJ/RimL family protein N-acetyltransferase
MKSNSAPEHLNKTIFREDRLRISVRSFASPETVDLLQRTVYGKHGPRYRQTGQEVKVHHLTNPYFFDLYADEQLVGTYCLSGRQVQLPAGLTQSFYGRYFSIDPLFNGKGYGSLLKSRAIQYLEKRMHPPFLFYSYVEESNERSMRISKKDGYQSLAVLDAILFSRLYPKADARVSRLSENELSIIQSLLASTYQDYTLVQFDQVYYLQNYFVLKEKGEVIAGIQANPIRWQIVDMPGLSGQFVVRLLPHLPLLRRLFNPHDHRFAVLEAAYVQPGREDALFSLMESVLAHFGLTSALWVQDVNSPFYPMVTSGKLGLLNAMQKSIRTHVMVKPIGLKENQIKLHPQQPIYVSGFDLS